MSKIIGFESSISQTNALDCNDTNKNSLPEKLFQAAYFSARSDRDEAEFASNKILSLMEKHTHAPISLRDSSKSAEFAIKVGCDRDSANSLVRAMDGAGYPLRVIFGPNKDRENDIRAFEDAKPINTMSNEEAVDTIKTFLNHSDRFQHSEDIVKSWNYVRCHPSNDPIACPDGPTSSVFEGSYLEISGAKNELSNAEYARLNGALKTLQERGFDVRVRFE
ncbi:MAG: hypothetical protein K2X77_11555 [Candidatus Obscuribacterales bacterium]|jgi:hypothetical protein|nr:hypothetical protein [Candidatus Obscuribacterales bacterium]